jgi:hypothetical protein
MSNGSFLQRCGFMLLWAAPVLAACSDSTPLGSVECIGTQIRCGLTIEQRDAPRMIGRGSVQVATTDLEVLIPVWTGQPFEDPAYVAAPERLLADARGQLWRVASQAGRLTIEKLDREGVTIEERTIDPPKGARDPEHLSAFLNGAAAGDANSKSTVGVSWSRPCDGRAGDPADCSFNELLVFEDFSEQPRRVNLGSAGSGYVQANASGVWFVYDSPPHVDKLDMSANLIWRQTGLLGSAEMRGSLFSRDKLSVLVWPNEEPIVNLDLWRLSARGSIETRLQIAWQGGVEAPTYAVDTRGRDVIVGATRDGDLAMMRVLPNGNSEGGLVVRQEYRPLSLDAFALDANGAVYVTTTAGGWDPGARRVLLCQLPNTGRMRCFTLAEQLPFGARLKVDQILVPEPGVVYVRSGRDLCRYELPDA